MTAVLLACTCLAGCGTPAVRVTSSEEVELQRRAVDLLYRAAQAENPTVQANALEALADLQPRESRAYLRNALRAGQPLVRFTACAALGDLRDLNSLSEYRQLARDPDPRVQLAAAFAAYRCGPVESAASAGKLVAALHDSPDADLRAIAAQLIGRLGEPRAVKHLETAERQEQSKKVLIDIVGALARLGRSDGVQRLIAYTASEPESRVSAMLLLAEIAPKEAYDALKYRLGLGSEDEYLEVRLIAARGLARLGDKSGFALAISVLADPTITAGADAEKRFYLYSAAAHALGEIGDKRALGELRRLAEQQDEPIIQVAACYAIARICSR